MDFDYIRPDQAPMTSYLGLEYQEWSGGWSIVADSANRDVALRQIEEAKVEHKAMNGRILDGYFRLVTITDEIV